MILSLIAGFLSGSLPTAYLAGKMKGIDIRQHGSGNVGATNAFRVLGKKVGATVFLIDFLKGYLPTYFLSAAAGMQDWVPLAIGLSCILGHVFSPWLGFKGGKGIATGAGVLMALNGTLFAVAILLWLLCFFMFKIVSLSSLVAVGGLLAASLFLPEVSAVHRWFFGAIFLFVVWTHRSNIGRLIKGEERR